ncbi:MAG: hypothetical protein ACYC0C_07565 [Devosia sp.]
MVPDLADIEGTIARMEARHGKDPLFPVYQRLCRRFADDLIDPRDLALSKAAALMLIKFRTEDERSI